MNSSGVRPGRSSHAGVEAAEGAMRSGGDSRVDERAVVVRTEGRGAVKAVVVVRVARRESVVNFMVWMCWVF